MIVYTSLRQLLIMIDISFTNNYDYFSDNETLKSQTKDKNEYLLEATENPATVRGKVICDFAI